MGNIITDGRLENAEFFTTKNMGGALINPRFLVMHYTAGTSIGGTTNHFLNPLSQVSAHLIIDRDGRIAQIVPFNRVAWHAGGDSEWRPAKSLLKVKRLNFTSIGIELVNAGHLTRTQDGKFLTWTGKAIESADVMEVDPNAKGSFGKRFWHRYPEEQLSSALEAARAIVSEFHIEEILGHSDICHGRKTDPGPVFPMQSFRSALYPRA